METQTPAPAPAKKKRNLVPILIIVGVVVVIIIAGVAWKLSSSSSDANGKPAGIQAKALYKAWQAGNRNAAAKVATPDAVTQMFAIQTSESDGLIFGKCNAVGSQPLPKQCIWSRPGGELTMVVRKQNGNLVVTKVDLGAAATTPDEGSTTPDTTG